MAEALEEFLGGLEPSLEPFAAMQGAEPLPDSHDIDSAYRALFETLELPASPPLFCCSLRAPSAFAYRCWAKCRGVPDGASAAVSGGEVAELPAFQFELALTAPPPSAVPSDVHAWTAVLADLLAMPVPRKAFPAMVVEPQRGLSPLYAATAMLARGAWAILPPDGPPLARREYYATLLCLFDDVQCARFAAGCALVCRGFRRPWARDRARIMQAAVERRQWWPPSAPYASPDIRVLESEALPCSCARPSQSMAATFLQEAIFCSKRAL